MALRTKREVLQARAPLALRARGRSILPPVPRDTAVSSTGRTRVAVMQVQGKHQPRPPAGRAFWIYGGSHPPVPAFCASAAILEALSAEASLLEALNASAEIYLC